MPSPPPTLYNARMWVGGTFDFGGRRQPLTIGERATETLRAESVELKKGGMMCFVSTGREIVGQRGGSARETRTHVYRLKQSRTAEQSQSCLPVCDVG